MLIQGPILDQLLVSDESGPPSVFIHMSPKSFSCATGVLKATVISPFSSTSKIACPFHKFWRMSKWGEKILSDGLEQVIPS